MVMLFSDVNINKLLEFHKSHGKICTLTSVSIAQQKGVLDIDSDNNITAFREKEDTDGAVINGGYMVCNPEIFEYLKDDTTVFEQEPMKNLASKGELKGFYHDGFLAVYGYQERKRYAGKFVGDRKCSMESVG